MHIHTHIATRKHTHTHTHTHTHKAKKAVRVKPTMGVEWSTSSAGLHSNSERSGWYCTPKKGYLRASIMATCSREKEEKKKKKEEEGGGGEGKAKKGSSLVHLHKSCCHVSTIALY